MTESETHAAAEPGELTLTENAARRVERIIADDPGNNLRLRVRVDGGGCSGFQYGFSLDDAETPDDRVFSQHGVEFVVDLVSLDLLAGSEIDFVEDLIGAAFSIRNPNAASSCGCGNSFAI